MRDSHILAIILAGLIALLAIICIFTNRHEAQHIYDKPGTCPHCGTVLEKTVKGNAYHTDVVWYCPKNDCPW